MTGQNKPSIKKVKKNILPPFSEWRKISGTTDVFTNGYEVSFTSNGYQNGFAYDLPTSYAGKTYSLSVRKMRGIKPTLGLYWRVGANWYNSKITQGMSKVEDIRVPSNATDIRVLAIDNNTSLGVFYYEGIQLEEGFVATEFEEQIIEGAKSLYELVPKNNLFDGRLEIGGYTWNSGQPYGNDDRVKSVNFIIVKPSNKYTLKATNGRQFLGTFFYKKDGTFISSEQKNVNLYNLTTPPDCHLMKFVVSGTSFDFNVQLEEGELATPYEPFQLVEKPIKRRLVSGKNLLPHIYKFDRPWGGATIEATLEGMKFTLNTANGTAAGITNLNTPFKSKKGQTYTFSFTARANRNGVNPNYTYFMRGNSDGTNKSLSGSTPALTTSWSRYSITGTYDNTSDGAYVLIGLSDYNSINVNGDWIEIKDVQLEEGSVATSYELGRLINKSSKKSSKNILDMSSDNWAIGGIAHASGNVSPNQARIMTKNFGDIEPNTTYAYSIPVGYDISFFQYKPDGVFIKSDAWLSNVGTLTTNSNTGKFKISVKKSDSSEFDNNIFSNLPLIQVEDGIVSTPYEKYGERNRISRNSIDKSPFKNYPFSFKRESVEYLDEIRYGLNQPRFYDEGIKVEEPTTNLAGSDYDTTFETYPIGNTTVFTNQLNGVDRLQISDEKSFRGKKSLKTTAGSRVYRTVPMVLGEIVTISADVYSTDPDRVSIKIEMQGGNYAWAIASSSLHTGSGWERLSVTFYEPVTSNSTCYYFLYHNHSPNPVYWDNIQVEKKPYPTSYTELNRPLEKIDIPADSIDQSKGSIEVEFEFDENFYDYAKNHSVLFDMSDGTLNGRTVTYFNHSTKDISVMLNQSKISNVPHAKGERIKLKIEWDGIQTKVYKGNVLISTLGASVLTKPKFFIGRNLNGSERMNGIVYSFIVKDRNGRTTFQL